MGVCSFCFLVIFYYREMLFCSFTLVGCGLVLGNLYLILWGFGCFFYKFLGFGFFCGDFLIRVEFVRVFVL